jgi:peptidoglycan hydrolase CwlO-like protein
LKEQVIHGKALSEEGKGLENQLLLQVVDGLKELRHDVNDLKKDMTAVKDDISEMKKDISGLKEDVSGL